MVDSGDNALDHSPFEDIVGVVVGTFLCALGLQFLTHLDLITGQTAGAAVMLSYLSNWSFGVVFFVVNLPFYALAYMKLGLTFTLKSLAAVTLLAVMADGLPLVFSVGDLAPGAGALIFGVLCGTGLLVMFRHNASLGGLGVVALIVQDSTGFRAGYFQLVFDVLLFAIALLFFPLESVIWSLAGAVVVNLIIAMNHRKDRYIAR